MIDDEKKPLHRTKPPSQHHILVFLSCASHVLTRQPGSLLKVANDAIRSPRKLGMRRYTFSTSLGVTSSSTLIGCVIRDIHPNVDWLKFLRSTLTNIIFLLSYFVVFAPWDLSCPPPRN